MRDKRIITDADGVLVNWIDAFMKWAKEEKHLVLKDDYEKYYSVQNKFKDISDIEGHALVHEFNRSDIIRNLEPFRDAKKYMDLLIQDGYEFHCITAIEAREDIIQRRTQNLKELFGDVFAEITCVGQLSDKKSYLEEYRDTRCFWIEDSISHAEDGHDVGLETILMTHHYNVHFEHDDIHRVDNWADIYRIITEG